MAGAEVGKTTTPTGTLGSRRRGEITFARKAHPHRTPLTNSGPATNRSELQRIGEGELVVLNAFVLKARQEGAVALLGLL